MPGESIDVLTVEFDQAALNDLRSRLRRTRLPVSIPASGWKYGMNMEWLRSLLDYWETDFDWTLAQARINKFDHFTTRIRDHAIHFVHARSRHAQAQPLLMIHGWPGSIVEFLGVVDRLRDPQAHGGTAADAFHLIMPSLPGFGLSEQPRAPGWGPAITAEVYAELMGRLGYHRYGVQGGDFGAIVAAEMALAVPSRLTGLHTNMPLAPPPSEAVPLTPDEEKDVAQIAAFNESERAYAMIQATKPDTIGVGLTDSPAALCAWVAEKFYGWSDMSEAAQSALDRDTLLTNITLYWLTGTGASAARYYYEHFHATPVWLKDRVSVPTGVARFPKEMIRPPRAWVEQKYNVVHWTEMPYGGHFAALEQPALFTDDVRAFFRTLRDGPAIPACKNHFLDNSRVR